MGTWRRYLAVFSREIYRPVAFCSAKRLGAMPDRSACTASAPVYSAFLDTVSIPDDPLVSVVLGIGRMLSDFKLLRKISID